MLCFKVWSGKEMHGEARWCDAWYGSARSGKVLFGPARCVKARCGVAWHGFILKRLIT